MSVSQTRYLYVYVYILVISAAIAIATSIPPRYESAHCGILSATTRHVIGIGSFAGPRFQLDLTHHIRLNLTQGFYPIWLTILNLIRLNCSFIKFD